ncbi:uncharacterized protein LOC127877278 [Dreissena polymorpha]|uniref:non-specific serine/threonine protein kinase n=1 Tax=Dreissena polymorpha TaxID=45954 RepID=A0A9D4QVS6_DREPO|nr:uncharacterized protein LOC127877278 [Dreissena polymorpha]KAH3844005.1 hypothetical protein DPMN_117546 [Dreissena polymorpha]
MGDQEEISTEGIDPKALASARVLQSVAKEISNDEDQTKQLRFIVETIANESLLEDKDYLVLTGKTREFVNNLGFTTPFSVSKTKDIINILLLMWNHTNVTRYVMKSVYNVDIASTADEMIDQFPSDLKQLDAQSAEIFAKALKDGSEKVKNIRLMVVGMFGVGKTSLVKNLIKDLRDENLKPVSTEVIELRRCQLMENGDWCLDKDQKEAKYKIRYQAAFKEAIHTPTVDDFSSCIPSTLDETTPDSEVNDSVTEKPTDALEEIKKHVEERKDDEGIRGIIEFAKKVPEVGEDVIVNIPVPVATTGITVSVWDFAGQTLYYSTHQFFLNKRSIYLVLMDMTKKLDECIQEDETSGIWCGLSEECKYLDVFKFWLNAIHMYSGYRSMTGNIKPTVILVGTHKDKMEGSDEEKEVKKDKYFEKALQAFRGTKILRHIHRKKYLVNNLTSDDPVFKQIRKEIRRLAEKQEFWNENYPVRWIQMEQSLDKLRDSGKQLLQRNEVNAENQSNVHPVIEKELDLFLDIQHRHGNILYFNTDQLKHLVVLAPQWIIEVFKCFISHIKNKDPQLSVQWSEYKKNAILKPEIFSEIMDNAPPNIEENRQHIMMYMEQLDVMAKPLKPEECKEIDALEEPEQETSDAAEELNVNFLDFHIVPCRLKNPPPPIVQFTSPENCKKTPVLCFVFIDNFMPPSFFHRLVAVCIRTWPISQQKGKNLLYNGLAVFEIRATYRLTIWYKDHIIYARISSCSKEPLFEFDFKLCHGVRRKLRHSLENFVAQSLENPWTARKLDENIQCPYMKESSYNAGMFRVKDFVYNRELSCTACPEQHAVGREEAMKDWYKEALDRMQNDDDLNRPVEESDLTKAAKMVGKEYWMLGIELGLTDAEMEQLNNEKECKKNRSTFVFRYMVMWKDKEGKTATLQNLQKAMQAAILNH